MISAWVLIASVWVHPGITTVIISGIATEAECERLAGELKIYKLKGTSGFKCVEYRTK